MSLVNKKINEVNDKIHDHITALIDDAIKSGDADEAYLTRLIYALAKLHEDMRKSANEEESGEQLNIFCTDIGQQ